MGESEDRWWMCCRFENAAIAIEKAGQIDPQSIEVSVLLNNVRLVARARTRGNDLFKSERFTEASSAYGEGLRHDPSNSVLYCNRAACWFKLGLWEHSVDDCNQALRIQPNYTKALLRRAASNSKVELILKLCVSVQVSMTCWCGTFSMHEGSNLYFRTSFTIY